MSEAWGFKFNSLQEFEEFDGKGELQAESEEEIAEEAVEESAEEPVEDSTEEPVEESAGEEELEESAGEEELEESDEEVEEKRMRGRGGDARNLRGPLQPGMRMTEAKVREILKKAINFAKSKGK